MINNTRLRTAVALAVAAASSQALANGVAVNEQSASSMGTGFAGRSSSAQDASTVFGNPAGMSKIERTQISGGFAVVDAQTDISNVQSAAPGTNDGDMVPFTAIPFGYYVKPLSEKWHFGLGVYVPFGVISDYEDSFQGRYHGLESEVQVVTVQPTISYRINERTSVGIGPTINHIEGTLTRDVLTPAGDGNVDIQGDDVAYGFNVGVLADLTERLALGLTYHSKVDYSLEGETELSNFPIPVNGEYNATLDVTTPESIDLSLTYEHNDDWTLYAGATWTRWSQFDQLQIENPDAQAPFDNVQEGLDWSDTASYAIGAAYQVTPTVVLRTGLAFDPSPTNDDDRTVRIPVSDRTVFSLGAGWEATPDLMVDVAYAYLHEDEGGVSYSGSPSSPAYSADYNNSAHGLAAQVTYSY